MAIGIGNKAAVGMRAALLARSAVRSLFLLAIISGLCLLVRQHGRILPTLLAPFPSQAESRPEADNSLPIAAPAVMPVHAESGSLREADRRMLSAAAASRPRHQPRPMAVRAPDTNDPPRPASVAKKEAPTSLPPALSKNEPRRLATIAPAAPGKASEAKAAAAAPQSESASASATASDVAAGHAPEKMEKKREGIDWEKEEIMRPIDGAYAVVYLSRRFLGLCLEGKYIRRYRQIRVSLPADTPAERVTGHWRVAEREEDDAGWQLRLVRAAAEAEGPREVLLCAEGQAADLPVILLEPGQLEEIGRALSAEAWVVIQP